MQVGPEILPHLIILCGVGGEEALVAAASLPWTPSCMLNSFCSWGKTSCYTEADQIEREASKTQCSYYLLTGLQGEGRLSETAPGDPASGLLGEDGGGGDRGGVHGRGSVVVARRASQLARVVGLAGHRVVRLVHRVLLLLQRLQVCQATTSRPGEVSC